MILALLPLNEIRRDENHKWVCDRTLIDGWAASSACEITDYAELDHYVYYTLPIFQARGLLGRFAAQGFSLCLGVAVSCMSPQMWFRIGEKLGSMIGAKPTQAVVLLKPIREQVNAK